MAELTIDGGNRRGNKWRPFVWGAAACLLAMPLVAMQFTSEVNWTGGDFVAMGLLLAIACGIYELGAWLSGNTFYRAAFATAVLGGFLVVWANLAVGMIGDEGDAVNLLWVGVLGIGIVGALIARFKAPGMALALLLTGIAHLAVVAYAFAAGLDDRGATVSAVFALPWLASAALFREAARQPAR